eukprot:GHVP01052793.1.p1 GENE.GHVP01052793.1~~GHVP01052793.1.p1  ORF type:complete len:793 (+),score=128.83 GHVP01052793.1:260-2638(+)
MQQLGPPDPPPQTRPNNIFPPSSNPRPPPHPYLQKAPPPPNQIINPYSNYQKMAANPSLGHLSATSFTGVRNIPTANSKSCMQRVTEAQAAVQAMKKTSPKQPIPKQPLPKTPAPKSVIKSPKKPSQSQETEVSFLSSLPHVGMKDPPAMNMSFSGYNDTITSDNPPMRKQWFGPPASVTEKPGITGGWCLCGGKQQRDVTLRCVVCNHYVHPMCLDMDGTEVQSLITKVARNDESYDFMCPFCRFRIMDPFLPPEKVIAVFPLLHPPAEIKFTINLPKFHEWKRQTRQIIVRALKANSQALKHEWPETISIRINDNPPDAVNAPQAEHKRRDIPFNVTRYLKPFRNSIHISWSNFHPPQHFAIGFFLTQTRTDSDVARDILEKRLVSREVGRRRIVSLLNESVDSEDVSCMETSSRMRLTCPLTLLRITYPARGATCRHLQCFDLEAFVQVTHGNKAFNNRWKCPECNQRLFVEDIVVDGFVLNILEKAQNVDLVELDKEAKWKTIGATEEPCDYENDEGDSPRSEVITKQEEALDTNLSSQPPPSTLYNPTPAEVISLDTSDEEENVISNPVESSQRVQLPAETLGEIFRTRTPEQPTPIIPPLSTQKPTAMMESAPTVIEVSDSDDEPVNSYTTAPLEVSSPTTQRSPDRHSVRYRPSDPPEKFRRVHSAGAKNLEGIPSPHTPVQNRQSSDSTATAHQNSTSSIGRNSISSVESGQLPPRRRVTRMPSTRTDSDSSEGENLRATKRTNTRAKSPAARLPGRRRPAADPREALWASDTSPTLFPMNECV